MELLERLLIVGVTVAVGTGLAVWLLRALQRPVAPVIFEAPTQLDRQDFAGLGKTGVEGGTGVEDAIWLLVVFTAIKCTSCATVWKNAQEFAQEFAIADTAALEISSPAKRKLHKRYGVEAVPLTVLADESGQVRFCHLGFLGDQQKEQLVEVLATNPSC